MRDIELIDESSVITIFDSGGFVGSYLVRILAKTGAKINIVSRDRRLHDDLALCGNVGQIVYLPFSDNRESLTRVLKEVTHVVNLINSMDGSRDRLESTNLTLVRKIAHAARIAKVKRLVHVSALGAGPESKSIYLKAKFKGEKAALHEFLSAIIIRPGLIIGAEDNFTNLFAGLAKILPIIPLIGGGTTKIQPIYVGDVAQVIYNALIYPKKEVCGKTFSIAGFTQYSMREIVETVLNLTQKKRMLLPIPFWLAYMQALFLGFLPNPPFTRHQVQLLRLASTLSKNDNSIEFLGVTPRPVEAAMQKYLGVPAAAA